MKINLDFRKIGVASLLVFFCSSTFAQGTPVDQYKQMGGIAAVAESCYASEAIPQKLKPIVASARDKNPSVAELLQTLVAQYNKSYYKAVLDRRIWNGTKQDYSKVFNCADKSDVEQIKKFEQLILDNLK